VNTFNASINGLIRRKSAHDPKSPNSRRAFESTNGEAGNTGLRP
jgi:hypothetical protein